MAQQLAQTNLKPVELTVHINLSDEEEKKSVKLMVNTDRTSSEIIKELKQLLKGQLPSRPSQLRGTISRSSTASQFSNLRNSTIGKPG